MDDGGDDLVDRVAFNVQQVANGQWSFTHQQTGYYGIVTMGAEFRVGCNTNYYGHSCTTYCAATDSTTDGHYTCDVNGNKVCNAGYRDPTLNCLSRKQSSDTDPMD